MKLEAIFFDMGGTIDTHTYDRAAGVRATADMRIKLRQAGVDLELDDEELYDRINEGQDAYRRWREASWIELPPEKVWREFVLGVEAVAVGQLAEVAEDLAYAVETRFYQRRMRPEVPEVLQSLRRMGLKLGVISNIQSRRQVPDDLCRYGIRDFFDPVVLSCEYGRRKPDPAIFDHGAALIQSPPSSCAHIGDRISRDVLGARQAGFALALQIRHAFTENPEPEKPRPDAVLETMAELPGLLESLTTPSGVSSRSS
jgi:putative hydrolase of the HAD superfamily